MSKINYKHFLKIYTVGFIIVSLTACEEAATGIDSKKSPSLSTIDEALIATIPTYKAQTLNVFPAEDADQGVAVDSDYFYAVDNYVLAKHKRVSGEIVSRWQGKKGGQISHMNSCYAEEGHLFCANSNYPEIPMASSIERFNTSDLSHAGSYSLGVRDEGSLTWFSPWNDGWIAGFAHYGGEKGLPFKDAKYSSVVTFDSNWRRSGGWMLPRTVTARMAPYAASGGQIGPDGLLYVMGHDLPEMYVLGRPNMGPKLIHLATIELEARGQAFSFDPTKKDVIFAIDRGKNIVLEIRLPELDLILQSAKRF